MNLMGRRRKFYLFSKEIALFQISSYSQSPEFRVFAFIYK